MNEKELGEKLASINKIEAELPEHRRKLKSALLTFARLSSTSSAETERPGFSISRLKWQPALAGLLAVVVIAILAVSLPLFGGRSKEVSASTIALSSPEVQAVLNGSTAGPSSVNDKINTAGYSRVVTMGASSDKIAVSYVDVLNKQVVCILVGNIIDQDAGDAADQQALDIMNANMYEGPRFKALLSQGLPLYFMRFTVAYPSTVTDPQSIVGLPVVLFLKDQSSAKYYFIVDLNSGAVSGGGTAGVSDLPDGSHYYFSMMQGAGANLDDFHSMMAQVIPLLSDAS